MKVASCSRLIIRLPSSEYLLVAPSLASSFFCHCDGGLCFLTFPLHTFVSTQLFLPISAMHVILRNNLLALLSYVHIQPMSVFITVLIFCICCLVSHVSQTCSAHHLPEEVQDSLSSIKTFNIATISVPCSKRSLPPRLNSHVHIIIFMHACNDIHNVATKNC